MDEGKVVLIVLGIIFFVVRKLMSGDKKKKKPVQQRRKVKSPVGTKKQQSIDDIFNDFVKELEQKQPQKRVQPVKAVTKKKATTTMKSSLDWQQVETTHIPAKKQLIKHEDYHDISHRIDSSYDSKSVYETEKDVYSFDVDKIDFRDAIIAKEILDRKYC